MNLKALFSLTNNENRVLEVFTEKAILTTGDITKLTGISRPNCYDLLNGLIEKGLITKCTQNNAVFYSVNQIDYASIIEEKQKELNEMKTQVKAYNKKVNQALEEKSDLYNVEVFSGVKGLQKFHSQTFNTKQITTFGAEGELEKQYPNIWNIWIRKLKENNISFSLIYNEKSRKLRARKRIPFMKVRFIDREISTNTTTQVLDDQVNIFHWQKVPLVISIKNKTIAKAYREEFNLMWKNARE